jgi:hypothetical protein
VVLAVEAQLTLLVEQELLHREIMVEVRLLVAT